MSAITELLSLSKADLAARAAGRARGKVLAQANHSIPALWLSLFSADDLVEWALDRDVYDEPATTWSLAAATGAAVARSTAVVTRWRNKWPTLEPALTAWLRFLPRLRSPYVGVDTAELGLMGSPPRWKRTLERYLRAMSARATEVALGHLFEASAVRYSRGRFTAATSSLGVALGGDGANLPWTNLGAGAPGAADRWLELLLARALRLVRGSKIHELLTFHLSRKTGELSIAWYASTRAHDAFETMHERYWGVPVDESPPPVRRERQRLIAAYSRATLGRASVEVAAAGSLDARTLRQLGARLVQEPAFQRRAPATLTLLDDTPVLYGKRPTRVTIACRR